MLSECSNSKKRKQHTAPPTKDGKTAEKMQKNISKHQKEQQ